MADYPYSPNAPSVREFLQRLQTVGVPPKVTLKYLESLGFKSKNDRYIVSVLKDLGFLDSSGVPTASWQRYRHKGEAGAVLAASMRACYSDLFQMYPDAYRKDDEALRNFFTSHTSVADSTVTLMVRTFKALAELAEFGASTVPLELPVAERKTAPPSEGAVPASGITVNINIQLTLPETQDASIYDTIFNSLKKHLLT